MAEVGRRMRIGEQLEQEVTPSAGVLPRSPLPFAGPYPSLRGNFRQERLPAARLLIQVKQISCVRDYPKSSYASGGAPRDRLLGSS